MPFAGAASAASSCLRATFSRELAAEAAAAKARRFIKHASFRPHQMIVPRQPFVAVVVTEQFGARHPEHAPALPLQFRIGAVGVLEHGHERVAVRILVAQPHIRGFLVALA